MHRLWARHGVKISGMDPRREPPTPADRSCQAEPDVSLSAEVKELKAAVFRTIVPADSDLPRPKMPRQRLSSGLAA